MSAFWDWALALYEQPGVAPALLALQDEAGQNVPLLLWALWRDPEAGLAARGADLVRDWEAAAVSPLRQARRDLKTPRAGLDPAGQAALRRQVQAAELAAERLAMEALERLAGPPERPPAQAAVALARAARAWSGETPDFTALLAALDHAGT